MKAVLVTAVAAFGFVSSAAFAHGGSYAGPGDRPVPRFGGPAGRDTRPRPRHGPPDLTRDWSQWWALNERTILIDRAAARRAAGADDTIRRQTELRRAVLPGLLAALADDFFDARAGAAIGVGKVVDPSHPLYPGVVGEVRKLLRDPDKQVRESAILGLGILGDRSQVPDLLLIMKNDPKGRVLVGLPKHDVRPRERAFAAIAIGLIGSREVLDDSVIAELATAARGVAPETRPSSRR